MIGILKSDFYRLKKSGQFISALLLAILIAAILTLMNRQDIKLGISIFGDLTMFKSINDIVDIGISYQKGLGFFVAVVIAFFVGQEYQWNTWQHKWLISKSRVCMYISKLLMSVGVSISLFVVFEFGILLFAQKTSNLFAIHYLLRILCGCFVYMSLGSLICMISMLIKNSTIAVITSLAYIICSETVFSIVQNLSIRNGSKILDWILNHTIYGMSITLNSATITTSLLIDILITSFVIILLSSTIGILVFKKYEL